VKGLLLTNYYLVYRSIFAYVGLALLISGVLLFFSGPMVSGVAAMLIILLMTLPSLEVIKIESKSGYDKYVLTLPVSRSNIVRSHYIFYLSVVIIGAFLSYIVIYTYDLIFETQINGIINIISSGIFVVLLAGALIYPFLYIFGADKSDAFVLGGGFVGLFVYYGIKFLVEDLIVKLPLSIDSSLLVPILFIVLGITVFTLSYLIAVIIYRKKEF